MQKSIASSQEASNNSLPALLQRLPLTSFSKRYTTSILQGNELALIEQRSKVTIGTAPDFSALLAAPRTDRIPAMRAEIGAENMRTIVAMMLARFCNSLNLSRNMNAQQIAVAAEKVVSMAMADHVSLIELDVFLEGCKMQQYGKHYERMDEGTLLAMFDSYLEKRWLAFQDLRYEYEAQHKQYAERSSRHEKLLDVEAFKIITKKPRIKP